MAVASRATASGSTGLSGNVSPRRALLACGIVSSLLYVALNVVGALLYPGYSLVSQTISELYAIGASLRPLSRASRAAMSAAISVRLAA